MEDFRVCWAWNVTVTLVDNADVGGVDGRPYRMPKQYQIFWLCYIALIMPSSLHIVIMSSLSLRQQAKKKNDVQNWRTRGLALALPVTLT